MRRVSGFRMQLTLAGALLAAATGPAKAAVLNVPGDYATIQEAIVEAYYGDTVMVAAGVYSENINLLGKPITVMSEEGADQTTIDGSAVASTVTFSSGETLSTVLQGFTITNGSTTYGGGIHCTSSSPTIREVVVTGNQADYGGGLYLQNASAPSLEFVEVAGNQAKWGAGICSWFASPVLVNSIVSGNSADSPGIGGGLYVAESSNLTITNTIVASNTSVGDGGGMCVAGGSNLVDSANNVFADNASGGDGGGIAVGGCDLTETIQNSILWGNQASEGAQLSLEFGATVSVAYCDMEGGQGEVYVSSSSTLNWLEGMIDVDPEFETGLLSDYHLAASSLCIDAGNPGTEWNDPEDPASPGYALWPALGTVTNDMGAYGGGGAGLWTGISEPEGGPPQPQQGIVLMLTGNPFGSVLRAEAVLPVRTRARLILFDLAGRAIILRDCGTIGAGSVGLSLPAGGLCPGVYFLVLLSDPEGGNPPAFGPACARCVKLP